MHESLPKFLKQRADQVRPREFEISINSVQAVYETVRAELNSERAKQGKPALSSRTEVNTYEVPNVTFTVQMGDQVSRNLQVIFEPNTGKVTIRVHAWHDTLKPNGEVKTRAWNHGVIQPVLGSDGQINLAATLKSALLSVTSWSTEDLTLNHQS